MHRSFQDFPLLALVLITIAGCGSSDRPPLAPVSGRVTRDGEPVANATVLFIPNRGATSVGITDANGLYDLKYMNKTNGAAIDAHKVMVTIGIGAPLKPGDPPRPMTSPPEEITLPDAYNVTAGNNSIDLPLPSKKKKS